MTVRQGCGHLFTISWSENLAFSSQSNHMRFCCFSQRALHGAHSPYSHRCVVLWCWHMWCLCVYCLCLEDRVSFSIQAPVQSLTIGNKQGTDPYFTTQLYVDDHDHRKPVLIFPNGLSKPGERPHGRNFDFCRGWNSNTQPLDPQSSVLPVRYRRSLPIWAIIAQAMFKYEDILIL